MALTIYFWYVQNVFTILYIIYDVKAQLYTKPAVDVFGGLFFKYEGAPYNS